MRPYHLFFLLTRKKWNKTTKVGQNSISLSNMLDILQVSLNKKEKDSLFHIDNIFLSVSVILCIVFGAPYL